MPRVFDRTHDWRACRKRVKKLQVSAGHRCTENDLHSRVDQKDGDEERHQQDPKLTVSMSLPIQMLAKRT